MSEDLRHGLNVLFQVANVPLFGAICLVFLVGPGFFLYDLARKSFGLDRDDQLIVSVLGGALVGYLAFWAYFTSPWVGIPFSVIVMGLTVYALFRHVRAHGWKNLAEFRLPATLMLLTLLFYNGLIMARSPTDPGPNVAATVTGWQLPNDNMLPFGLAEHMYKGLDGRDMGSTWRSSDRPPLQSGYWLVVKPLFAHVGLNRHGYHAASTVLQALWILALFVLARACGDKLGHLAVALLFSLCSGFSLVNTVFVWPKLLAATFCTFCLVLLVFRDYAPKNLVLAGLSVGFAMLAHGGSMFALIILIPWWVLSRGGWRPSRFARFALPLILLLIPWSMYQKFYDPPGNRLVKMHLAGVDELDERSSLEAIHDAYRTTSWEQLLRMKIHNAKTSYIYASSADWLVLRTETLREGQFFSLMHTLGILNLGFLLAVFALVARIFGAQWARELDPHLKLLGFSAVVWVAWVLLEFPWGGPVIHQGPYLLPLLLIYSLARVVHSFFGKFVFALLAVHIALFFIIWGEVAVSGIPTAGWIWLTCTAIVGTIMASLLARRTVAEA